jgi:hypothetical protein
MSFFFCKKLIYQLFMPTIPCLSWIPFRGISSLLLDSLLFKPCVDAEAVHGTLLQHDPRITIIKFDSNKECGGLSRGCICLDDPKGEEYECAQPRFQLREK